MNQGGGSGVNEKWLDKNIFRRQYQKSKNLVWGYEIGIMDDATVFGLRNRKNGVTIQLQWGWLK